jgi:predicted ester cyclase
MARLAWRSLALLILLLPAGAAWSQDVAPITPLDLNKSVVRRYLEDVMSAGQLEKLDNLVSENYVDRTPGAPPQTRGPAVIRESLARARTLFQDIHYSVEDLIAEGDRVVARYTVRASRKPADGSESPGTPIEVAGVTIFRVADGQIQETWIVNDQLQLFRQLGYTLQPPAAATPKPAPAPPAPPAKDQPAPR